MRTEIMPEPKYNTMLVKESFSLILGLPACKSYLNYCTVVSTVLKSMQGVP